MKVAVLTDFFVYDEAYSLCGVVDTQLKMLSDPLLIVDEAFPEDGTPWHKYEIRRIPGVPRSNEFVMDDTWDQDVEKMTNGLRDALKGVDVAISHDMVYQPSMGKMHSAARKVAAESPTLDWLHWIHSATASFAHQHAQMFPGKFPNSRIVFPNEYDRARVARNYGVPETDVVFVPHATDPIDFLMDHSLSKELAQEIDLLEADVIGCYPARLDRGKQVDLGINIFAALKRMGKSVRYIVVDFHSTGGDKVTYRRLMKKQCAKLGLELGVEVVFTSEWRKETHVRCPRQMVSDFMRIGDVLILPSRSETYSLVAQEAALCKNLLVLNMDFPPAMNIYGGDALYYKFSSNIDVMTGLDGETNTTYSNKERYMDEIAGGIMSRLYESMVLRQFRFRRKHRNPKSVYRDYLEPLLWRRSDV